MCMIITAVMIAIALGSTGYIPGNFIEITFPASCLFKPKAMRVYLPDRISGSHKYNSAYIVITIGLLAFSYLTRAIQLFPKVSGLVKTKLNTAPSNFLKRLWRFMRSRALQSSETLSHSPDQQRFLRLVNTSTRYYWVLRYRLFLSMFLLLEASGEFYGSLLWEVNPPLHHCKESK